MILPSSVVLTCAGVDLLMNFAIVSRPYVCRLDLLMNFSGTAVKMGFSSAIFEHFWLMLEIHLQNVPFSFLVEFFHHVSLL
jgi:hypothetical protein